MRWGDFEREGIGDLEPEGTGDFEREGTGDFEPEEDLEIDFLDRFFFCKGGGGVPLFEELRLKVLLLFLTEGLLLRARLG